jgi:hypothetical protein
MRLPATRSKHGNKKIAYGGKVFDSKRELNRYMELRIMERAGAISNLKTQVRFALLPSVTIKGRKIPATVYIADFTYTEKGLLVVEDAKSPHLRSEMYYRLKLRMLKYNHGIDVIEI